MRVQLSCVALLAALSWTSPSLAESTCPKGNAPISEEDLQAVDSCLAANALHEACEWGSAGDAGLSGVVIPKCEAGFVAKLTKAQHRVYDQRGEQCGAAYSGETNDMQAMQSALCQEELAVTYFKAAASGTLKGNPRWKGPPPPDQ